MNTRQLPYPSTRETNVAIIPVAPEEQSRRIEAAIAARAYEIFEKRGHGMARIGRLAPSRGGSP